MRKEFWHKGPIKHLIVKPSKGRGIKSAEKLARVQDSSSHLDEYHAEDSSMEA